MAPDMLTCMPVQAETHLPDFEVQIRCFFRSVRIFLVFEWKLIIFSTLIVLTLSI